MSWTVVLREQAAENASLSATPRYALVPGWWDGVVFAAAGWAVEAAGDRWFRLLCALAAVAPGLFFLLAVPELGRYGGLSGLATGAVAYLCFRRVFDGRKDRGIWLAILALIVAKSQFCPKCVVLQAVNGNSNVYHPRAKGDVWQG